MPHWFALWECLRSHLPSFFLKNKTGIICLRRLTFSQLSGKSWSLNVCIQIPRAWYFGSDPLECQEFRRQLLTRVNWFGYEWWWLGLLLTRVCVSERGKTKMVWEDWSGNVWWLWPTQAQISSLLALITDCLITFYSWVLFCGSLTAPTSSAQAYRDLLGEHIKSVRWRFDLLSIRKIWSLSSLNDKIAFLWL